MKIIETIAAQFASLETRNIIGRFTAEVEAKLNVLFEKANTPTEKEEREDVLEKLDALHKDLGFVSKWNVIDRETVAIPQYPFRGHALGALQRLVPRIAELDRDIPQWKEALERLRKDGDANQRVGAEKMEILSRTIRLGTREAKSLQDSFTSRHGVRACAQLAAKASRYLEELARDDVRT